MKTGLVIPGIRPIVGLWKPHCALIRKAKEMRPNKTLLAFAIPAMLASGLLITQNIETRATDVPNQEGHATMHNEAEHACTMMGDSKTRESSTTSPNVKLRHDAVMNIFMLPVMKEDLQLSQQQFSRLKDTKRNAVDQFVKTEDVRAGLTTKLQGLIDDPDVAAETLEMTLLELAKTEIRQTVDLHIAAAEMAFSLTPEQSALFETANSGDLHRQVMSNMPMSDMMEMMKIMSCEEMNGQAIDVSISHEMRQVIMGMMPPGWEKIAQADSASSGNCCGQSGAAQNAAGIK